MRLVFNILNVVSLFLNVVKNPQKLTHVSLNIFHRFVVRGQCTRAGARGGLVRRSQWRRQGSTMPPIIGETLRVWFLSALVVHGAVAGNPDAKRLYDDLLSNYNKLVRPVVNTSDVLRVCIKLKLSQLIDVVSENLILKHPLKRLDLIYASYNLISASYKKKIKSIKRNKACLNSNKYN